MRGLKRFLRRLAVTQKNRVIMLIDFENLLLNTNMSSTNFSLAGGFTKLIKKISREIGQIDNIFIFIPLHLASIYGEGLYHQGFSIILCPKVKNKEGEEEDTVDSTMLSFGSKIIHQIPSLTHLCIVSGDKDFRPLIQEAVRSGLRIIITAASLRSLSKDLIGIADKKPGGGRMVYIFSSNKE